MIRNVEEKDILEIVRLEEEIFGETLGYEMIKNELNNPVVKFRLIEENNKIIGYIGGYFYLEDGEILNFLIDESYQHKGYGTKLFDYIVKEAISNNVKRITLEVKQTNEKAIKFYLKNGFEQISIRKHYYKTGEDAIVMMKVLI